MSIPENELSTLYDMMMRCLRGQDRLLGEMNRMYDIVHHFMTSHSMDRPDPRHNPYEYERMMRQRMAYNPFDDRLRRAPETELSPLDTEQEETDNTETPIEEGEWDDSTNRD